MYTIIIRDDNTLESTIRTHIIEKQNMVDEIHFLINPTYQSGTTSFDMTDFTCTLEYVLPISKTYVPEVLTASADLYEGMLEYVLPVDTKITNEVGDVTLKFIFTYAALDPDTGKNIDYVRKTTETTLRVLPISKWSDYIASTDLDNIAQIMLNLQTKINQEKAYAEQIEAAQVDDLGLDDNKVLHVSAKGTLLGDGIDVALTKPDEDDGTKDNIIDLNAIEV